MAVTAFDAEKMQNGVSGVTGTKRGPRGVVGAVAAGVADRAVDQHLAAAADAQLDGGVHTPPVEPLDGTPHALDGVGLDAHVPRVDLGIRPADGHCRRIGGNAAARDEVAGHRRHHRQPSGRA